MLNLLALKSKIALWCCVFKDELEVWYKLHSGRDVEVLRSRVTDLADGRLHTVIIRRQADIVSVKVHTLTATNINTVTHR